MPDDWRRALAVVAHPDDLEYGCSAAIAALDRRGPRGRLCPGDPGRGGHRHPGARASAARCGSGSSGRARRSWACRRWSSSTTRTASSSTAPPCAGTSRRPIRRHRPELVITLNHRDTWGGVAWNTPDHVAVGRATLDAAGDAGNRWIFPELVEQGLEPWNGVRWVAVAGSTTPTHAVDATPGLERAVPRCWNTAPTSRC